MTVIRPFGLALARHPAARPPSANGQVGSSVDKQRFGIDGNRVTFRE